MAYVTPSTNSIDGATTASAWNVVVNDVIDHETRILKSGLILVSSTTFTASTAFNIDSVFTSTYANYRIIIGASNTAIAGTGNVSAQMRIGGVSYAGANYVLLRNNTNGDATTSLAATTGGTNWGAFATHNGTDASSQPAYQFVDLAAPQLAAWTQFNSLGFNANNTTLQTASGVTGGVVRQTTQYDGIGFTATSAVTGTIRIYGYLNS